MVKIGGLGFFNTIASSVDSPANPDGFDGTFGKMIGSALTGLQEKTAGNQGLSLQFMLSEQELGQLSAFLETGDLAELEEGMQVLQGLMNGTEGSLLDQALSHLGIEADEFKALLSKWSAVDDTLTEETGLFASLAAYLAAMADLPQKELPAKIGKEEMQAIKSAKLIQLMAGYSDSNEQETIEGFKDSLRLIGSKLESVLAGKGMTEQIQTRFTRLAADLNLSNTKKIEISGQALGELKTEGTSGSIPFLPQMARAEQLTLMLQNAEKPVSAEQLMKQFESILSRSQFMSSGGTQKLFIKLYPEHLGSLRIEIFQKDQTMMARIITSTATAKETLESQINGLKQAFAAQNISVDRIEVAHQAQQQERFLNRDSQQHQQQRQPDRQTEQKQGEHEDFSLSFEEALLNTEA